MIHSGKRIKTGVIMIKFIFTALILTIGSSITIEAVPKTLILIRNAEDNPFGDSLSPKGKQRAAALPYFIFENYGDPTTIHTTNNNSYLDSNKPYETLIPISEYVQTPIISFYTKNHLNQLIDSIINDPTNDNKLAILGLTNDLIPKVTQYLKVKDAPDTWSSDIYDRLWVLTFNDDGNITFENKPQALLYGDSPN
jgi:hypothetical protein